MLSRDDESLVSTMRRGLAAVAAALGAAKLEGVPRGAVCAALDGAELVMRGELVSGNAAQLPSLMPSFVFLVALPIVEQGAALELAHRHLRADRGDAARLSAEGDGYGTSAGYPRYLRAATSCPRSTSIGTSAAACWSRCPSLRTRRAWPA